MIINIKILNKNATIPEYKTAGAACFDLAVAEKTKWFPVIVDGHFVCWEAKIPTGLAFEIPEGYRLDIYPRSSMGFKHNAQLANGTGKIDSDYRGEVMIKMIAFTNYENLPDLNVGTRIVQCELNKVTQSKFTVVDELSETVRGEAGFGSTGK